jgi:hypothetical protein
MTYKTIIEIDALGQSQQVNKSVCCDATLTFVESELCCKSCFESVWTAE